MDLGLQMETRWDPKVPVVCPKLQHNPGRIDFDQTFCATMRSTSLRLLGAIAAKYGLSMRRWDFTAAYLQGHLEEGEVVYCSMPPGYDVKGSDGLSRVCEIVKPCYGISHKRDAVGNGLSSRG